MCDKSGYTVCKFSELWSSNSGVYEGERCTPTFSFFKINFSDKLSQNSLERFSPNFYHNGRYLIRKLLIWSSFSYRSRDVAMTTNFRVRMGEIGRLAFIRHLGIPKRSGMSQFRFQTVYPQWSGYIVQKFGELQSINSGVQWVERRASPRRSAVWLSGATARPRTISTEFSGAITTQFCFSYSLGGVNAMPRGLHVRFHHAFLVYFYFNYRMWMPRHRLKLENKLRR